MPGQVLHDEVGHVGVLALVEDVDDVRVREAGGRARLLDEPRSGTGVVGEVPVHDLDRDAPLEAQVGREVDGGHAAAGDARAHLIPAVDETADQRVGVLTVLTLRVYGAGMPDRHAAERHIAAFVTTDAAVGRARRVSRARRARRRAGASHFA